MVVSLFDVLKSIEVNSGSFKVAPENAPFRVKVLDAGADIPVIGKGRRGSAEALPRIRMPISMNYKNLTVCRRKGTDIGARPTKGHPAMPAIKTGCGFNLLKSGYIMNWPLKRWLATMQWRKIC